MPDPAPVKAVIRTLLVTDLVDSTGMNQALGDLLSAQIWAAHDEMARGLLQVYDGCEIDKTDGFLFVFERPIDALAYAVAYHDQLARLPHQLQLERQLAARAGIHLGEVVLRENTPEHIARGAKRVELEGIAKPTAARIMSLALGGQTLLSRAAFDIARHSAIGNDRLPREMRWEQHGAYVCQGIAEPITICEAGIEGRAPFVPPPSSPKVKRLDAPAPPAPPAPAERRAPSARSASIMPPAPECLSGIITQRRVEIPIGLDAPARERLIERLQSAVREQAALAAACGAIAAIEGTLAIDDDFIVFRHEPLTALPEVLRPGSQRDIDLSSLYWVAASLLRALSAAAAKGFPHGALQPNSIGVDRAGRLKVADFGLAAAFEAACPHQLRYLAVVHEVGDNPGEDCARWCVLDDAERADWIAPYFAHELLRRKPRLTLLSDQFALGMLLYLLATGQHALGGDFTQPGVNNHLFLRPEPLSLWRPDWKDVFERRDQRLSQPADQALLDFEELLQRLMALAPESRFRSPAEAEQAIRPYIPAEWDEAARALAAIPAQPDGQYSDQAEAELARVTQKPSVPPLWRQALAAAAPLRRPRPAMSRSQATPPPQPAAPREAPAPKPRTAAPPAPAEPRAPEPATKPQPVRNTTVSGRALAVGIDLGTNTARIARIGESGYPVLFPDSQSAGNLATPADILIASDGARVGSAAAARLKGLSRPAAATRIKLCLGETAPVLKDGLGRLWWSEGLVALLLKKLRRDAKAYSATNIGGAVLTVPVAFSDQQRRALLHAASLAGLQVLDLIEAPLAIASHYGHAAAETDMKLLVLELDHGAVEASVLDISPAGMRLRGAESDSPQPEDRPTDLDVAIQAGKKLLERLAIPWSDLAYVALAGDAITPDAPERLSAAVRVAAQRVLARQPECAAVCGAAMLAQRRLEDGPTAGQTTAVDIQRLTSHDLCLRVLDKKSGQPRLDVLIPRDTPFPARCEKVFYVNRAGQNRIVLDLVQCRPESPQAINLGRFIFPLEGARKSQPLQVQLAYDDRGLVSVSATEPESGRQIVRQFDDQTLSEVRRLIDQRQYLETTPLLD